MSSDLRESIHRLDLFQGLPEADLDRLVAAARTREVAGERLVYRRGEASEAVYVVRSGALQATFPDHEVRLGPGDLFGEAALLADRPHAAEVKAVEDTSLLVLPRRALEELFERHPARRLRLRTRSVTRHLSNVAAAFIEEE